MASVHRAFLISLREFLDGDGGSSVVVLHREALPGGTIRAACLRCARRKLCSCIIEVARHGDS